MTLVIAIGCTDGVVIAADSASSDPQSGTKQLFEKIKRIRDLSILYGGSGDVGLLQKIEDNLATYSQKNRLKRIRQEIKRLIIPELKESRDLHVPYPQSGFHEPPQAILLFAGIYEKKPWILEIEKDGRDTIYGQELGNFAAIGSGKPWAQAVFRPHLRTERDLGLGKIFAYRVVEDSINLAAAYLAEPIHMYTISSDGTVKKIEKEELHSIADTCELWRNGERETVGKLLAGKREEESKPEIPTPEGK